MILDKPLTNIGVTMVDYTDEQLKPIWIEINKIRNCFDSGEKYNSKLAGHIKKEYSLDHIKDYAQSLTFPAVDQFISTNNFLYHISKKHSTLENKKLTLTNFWVNFQKKHEYNPPHRHNGVISFVIWMDVPYLMDSELEYFPDLPNNKNNAGCFNFHYSNILGEICVEPLFADITYQNKCVIFPAELLHSVNPFYSSDEYRISVAGNWEFI
jgi:hypothetical protein